MPLYNCEKSCFLTEPTKPASNQTGKKHQITIEDVGGKHWRQFGGGAIFIHSEAKITKMRYHIKPYIFLFCFVWRYSIIIYLERWNVICGILLTHQIPPVSVNITVGPNFLKIPQKREYNIIFTDQNITETIFKKNVRFPFYKSFLAIFGKKIDF